MTPPRPGQCFLGGVLAGLGVIGYYTARTLRVIIKDGRIGDLVRFTDMGAKK